MIKFKSITDVPLLKQATFLAQPLLLAILVVFSGVASGASLSVSAPYKNFPASLDLTATGTTDWVSWVCSDVENAGTDCEAYLPTDASPYARKNVITPAIGDLITHNINNDGDMADLIFFAKPFTDTSWSDGIPTMSGNLEYGLLQWCKDCLVPPGGKLTHTGGLGTSFTFPVTATTTTTNVLDLYLGGFRSKGTLTVTLGGLEEIVVIDFNPSSPGGTAHTQVVLRVEFEADAVGDMLSAEWKQTQSGAIPTSDFPGVYSNISIKAATLAAEPPANTAPVIELIMGPTEPVNINDQPVSVVATFTDPDLADTHTCIVDYGDGLPGSPGLPVFDATGLQCVGPMHNYAEAGVYTVDVTVIDDKGGTDTQTFEFIVIFDPNEGFVTGGGWIDSPEGACPIFCNDATGKANFGFVSKYKKGASVPTGNTEFNFRAGDLNFHSSSYDWLVIAGAKAMYKGTGSINGTDGYTFQINAIDGQVNGDGVDKFRIKIKSAGDGVIYDNQHGATDNDDPMTAIGGGNIKVHKK